MSSSASSTSSAPTLVPLPPRQETPNKVQKPPVWPLTADSGVSTPIAAKCDRGGREDGVCCKELITEQRTLIDPDVVRDVYVFYILIEFRSALKRKT